LANISPFSFNLIAKRLFFLIGILHSAPGGQDCGRSRAIPLSLGIMEVTKKKIKSKKAMSAILPAFTEDIEFLIIENGLVFSFQKTKKVPQFFQLWKHVPKE
jgi:hypothetical protein